MVIFCRMENSPSSSTPICMTFQALETQGENHGRPSPIVDSSLSRSEQTTILEDGPTEDLSLTTCAGSLADDEATILQTPRDPEFHSMEISPVQKESVIESLPTPGIAYRTRSKDKEILNPKIMI